MNWILSKGLTFAGSRLNGYKTKIGGLGLILLGVVGLVNIMFPETVPGITLTMEEIIGYFTGGFVAIGIGGKIDKNTAAVQEAGNVVQGSEPQRTVTPTLSAEQQQTLNGP